MTDNSKQHSAADRWQIATAALAIGEDKSELAGECVSSEQINAYLARALGADETQLVEHHLAHCESCRQTWLGLIATNEVSTAAQSETAQQTSPGLLAGLLSRFSGPRAFAGAALILVFTVIMRQMLIDPVVPFAEYSMVMSGGTEQYRSGTQNTVPIDAPIVIDAGNQLEIVVRPNQPVEGATTMALYLQDNNQATQKLVPSSVDTAQNGSFRLTSSLDTTPPLIAGQYKLLMVIARDGKQPDVETLRSKLNGLVEAKANDWQAWVISIDYRTSQE